MPKVPTALQKNCHTEVITSCCRKLRIVPRTKPPRTEPSGTHSWKGASSKLSSSVWIFSASFSTFTPPCLTTSPSATWEPGITVLRKSHGDRGSSGSRSVRYSVKPRSKIAAHLRITLSLGMLFGAFSDRVSQRQTCSSCVMQCSLRMYYIYIYIYRERERER